MNIVYMDAEQIEKQGAAYWLKNVDAILVPGGFGNRGVEDCVSRELCANTKCLTLGSAWGYKLQLLSLLVIKRV